MTRKHFIAIAATLDANRAPLALVQDFADMLEEQNERFDRPRFIEAATINIRREASYFANRLAGEGVE